MVEAVSSTPDVVVPEQPVKVRKAHVPKPDKSELQARSDEIQAQISALQNEAKEIKAKMDKIFNDRSGSKGEFEAAKTLMQALIAEKKQLVAEKNALGDARDAARDKINARINAEKAARSDLKFSSLEAIDKQIRDLESKQARTTMSLTDEKKIIKEIKALQASKKTVATLADMKQAIEALKVEKSAIDKNYLDKASEVKRVNERLTAQREVLDSLNKDNSQNREAIPSLRQKQSEIKEQVNSKYQQIKALRAEFKAKEDAYYAHLAEERARKKEARQKEIEARKAQEEERRKALEAAELARIPYEEEINLCDYLVTYLETFVDTSKSTGSADTAANSSQAAAVEGFAGMKVLKRDQEDFAVLGNSKKRGKKKGGGNTKKDVISHGVDTIDSFAMLDVVPPTNVQGVPAAIEQLKEKKTYYQGLERGAVESISSRLRNEKEKKAAAEGKKKTGKTVFNLESDFPGLTVAEVTAKKDAVNSSTDQPVEEATPVSDSA
mmetsp:Transcript_2969/g.4497  ORF Transcript_2969/g.4497 Transcript_2969/m.4497 type:complete len:496 (+) Transcript_2969:73-1560(+)|eukprot:CAMPEP_0185024496 /NCGR_PEP_ID=MMETSP1103-20130426/7584_1 /TAXON_ID=36769 /ORGANISM="Paraphysomonas bandaiensis, Strain Caron Lab Isolate" /LENGTH=495 /DNA_ID=CAMNT_0027557479 /DNA_START=64 /DNA_END=1551 /DNA_ORIENTATION=+